MVMSRQLNGRPKACKDDAGPYLEEQLPPNVLELLAVVDLEHGHHHHIRRTTLCLLR
jgi:hypothetical protein